MVPIKLHDLLMHVPFRWELYGDNISICGITMDSRLVKVGDIFVAIRGERTDGHQYISEALKRGVSAVVGTESLSPLPVPYVKVPDGRQALAYLAAALYNYPSQKLILIGVTGTDGKTTTANMIYEIFKAAGIKVGLISTVNAVIGDEFLDTGFHVTTPEAPDIQKYLARMSASGMTYVILEATSHGLAQQRLAACDFDMAVVTNITHEHLDYHRTYTAYRSAKGSLFAGLGDSPVKENHQQRSAVLNRDDESFEYLSGVTGVPCLSYGLGSNADIYTDKTHRKEGLNQISVTGIDLDGEEFRIGVDCRLMGDYNVYNYLAAIAVTRGLIGIDTTAVQKGLNSIRAIAGRMEKIDLGQDFLAIVDFAHTPNALKCALQSGRKLTKGRVIVVFGSAGLRDRQKRRLMAETSAEFADLTVLTAEDPRTESLEDILEEMSQGMFSKGAKEGKRFWRIPDRREAIRFALSLAKRGDIVIACGKGHEQSMCFGTTEFPWDDRIAVRAALSMALGIEGPQMPFLPEVDPLQNDHE